MVTTQEFAEKMNALDPTSTADEVVQDSVVGEDIKEKEGDTPNKIPGENPGATLSGKEMAENEIPELVDQEDEESDDEGDDESDLSDSEEEEGSQQLRRSAWVRAGIKRPAHLRQITHTAKVKNNDGAVKEGIKKAQAEEIKLVFNDLKAVEVVMKEDIPEGVKAHNTHLFTVEKFLADGRHDKYISRLVAHGNEQDTTLYTDRSSPTASIHAIFSCLTVAACNPEYVVGKLDVKGTFIQTEMSGTPVYIQCLGKLRDIILKVRPDLARYIGRDRVLYGKLLKALYGCVQAS